MLVHEQWVTRGQKSKNRPIDTDPGRQEEEEWIKLMTFARDSSSSSSNRRRISNVSVLKRNATPSCLSTQLPFLPKRTLLVCRPHVALFLKRGSEHKRTSMFVGIRKWKLVCWCVESSGRSKVQQNQSSETMSARTGARSSESIAQNGKCFGTLQLIILEKALSQKSNDITAAHYQYVKILHGIKLLKYN